MIVKILAVLIAIVVTSSQAAEMPSRFTYKYTEDVVLSLYPDQCSKSDVSQGWIAKAENIKTGQKAEGCWTNGKDGNTVIMYLRVDEKTFVDFQLYKDKFKPEYVY